MPVCDPVHKYPDIFVNSDFFSPSSKIYASAHSLFESFSHEKENMKALKRWKYDSIPHEACVILVLYDV